ncbi:MAG: hypothetical protein VX681_12600 [Myxococcota bacterium]|nr:hypothetical protein [Myxococcota bacterium]
MRFRIAGFGIGVLAALAIAELGVRLLPSTVLGFDYRDGLFLRAQEFEQQIERNSLGVHDVEPARRRGTRRRVLLLGDSYVAASSVPIEQGVARRLAQHLEQRVPGGYDVVSLSSDGWGQREELAALSLHGGVLAPDLVLLLFTARNDPFNNARDLEGRDEDRRTRQAMMRDGRSWSRSFRSEDARGLWLPASALNRLIAHRLTVRALLPRDPVPMPFLAFSPERAAMWAGPWRETEQLLRQLRRRATTLDAGFAVVSASTPEGVMEPARGAARFRAAHPALADLEFDVDLPDRELASICQRLGIAFRALQPELRALEREEGPLHWRHDGHWNAKGNDAAGHLLADFVISETSLAPSRRP